MEGLEDQFESQVFYNRLDFGICIYIMSATGLTNNAPQKPRTKLDDLRKRPEFVTWNFRPTTVLHISWGNGRLARGNRKILERGS